MMALVRDTLNIEGDRMARIPDRNILTGLHAVQSQEDYNNKDSNNPNPDSKPPTKGCLYIIILFVVYGLLTGAFGLDPITSLIVIGIFGWAPTLIFFSKKEDRS